VFFSRYKDIKQSQMSRHAWWWETTLALPSFFSTKNCLSSMWWTTYIWNCFHISSPLSLISYLKLGRLSLLPQFWSAISFCMPGFWFLFLASYCQLCLQADAQNFVDQYIRALKASDVLIMKPLWGAIHNFLTYTLISPQTENFRGRKFLV